MPSEDRHPLSNNVVRDDHPRGRGKAIIREGGALEACPTAVRARSRGSMDRAGTSFLWKFGEFKIQVPTHSSDLSRRPREAWGVRDDQLEHRYVAKALVCFFFFSISS
jgi:hypothetical protein